MLTRERRKKDLWTAVEEELVAKAGKAGNECNQMDAHQLKEAKPVKKLGAKKCGKTKGGGDSPSDSSSSSTSADESVVDHSRSRSGECRWRRWRKCSKFSLHKFSKDEKCVSKLTVKELIPANLRSEFYFHSWLTRFLAQGGTSP